MGLNDFSAGGGQTETSGSRNYVQPTKEEFEECINSAREDIEWVIDEKAPSKEYVYDSHDFMPDYNGIVLRIYSTIDRRSDKARSKGADAIRLLAFNRHAMKPMGGRVKTLRIETYCKNLTSKINSLFEEYEQYVTQCEECGAWMVIREGRYGDFLGCTNYPDCEYTEQIE